MKYSKRLGVVLLVFGCAWQARAADAPTIPPSVACINPHGVKRGSTAVFTVEGRNIAGTRWVLFDAPGLTAKVGAFALNASSRFRAEAPRVSTMFFGAEQAYGRKPRCLSTRM